MKQLIFIFLLATQSLFSQTDTAKKVAVKPAPKTTQELLQGVWTSAESPGLLNYEFSGTKFLIMKGDSILFNCNDFELKKKALDTHCPGKEKLIFKIKSVSDSTLFMKSMSSDYYHKYIRVAKK